MPTVSVIIPTRNRADLLCRAVQSVLRQTFQDFELIIVDDHSSDGRDGFSSLPADSRIALLRHSENRGVAAARNTGLAHASGRYIALLDDDDEWHSDKLSRQMRLITHAAADVGLIYCGYQIKQDGTSRAVAHKRPAMRGRIVERMLLEASLTATSTVVVRKDCFDRVGGFDVSLRYGEDFDMWLRVAQHYRVDFVDDILVSVSFQREGLTQNYAAIISWTESHLNQYQEFFQRHTFVYADRLQKLGTFYCFNGDLRNGRRAFRRALDLDRFAVKNYACLALSFLGARAFRASYLTRDRVTDLMA